MRELRELCRFLHHYRVPHTVASAMATVSMIVGTFPMIYGFAILAGAR